MFLKILDWILQKIIVASQYQGLPTVMPYFIMLRFLVSLILFVE